MSSSPCVYYVVPTNAQILHTEKFTTFWLDQMREHGFGNHQIARYEVTKKLLARLEAAEIQTSMSDAENDIPPRGRSPFRCGSTPPAPVCSSRELSLAATPVMASSSTGKRKFGDVGNSDEPDCGKPHKAGMTGGKTITKSLLLALYLAPAVLRRFPHEQEEVESEEE